jgi:hypothetical protein
MQTAASPKLFTFREAGMQVSPVTMSRPSPRTAAPPCLPLDIKDSLKEDVRPFALGAFALRILIWAFWAFAFLDVGDFWKGKLLKGKELLKENC